MVTDTRTGLMWKRDLETALFNWSDALEHARAATDAGFSDWRLPNLKELRSLVEECRIAPTINDSIFPGTSNSNVWTSSPVVYDANAAWGVSFGSGSAYADGVGSPRSFTYSVRLVRGGQ